MQPYCGYVLRATPFLAVSLLGLAIPAKAASPASSAAALLQRSFVATRTSLHSVQATQLETLTQPTTPTSLTTRLAGSCAITRSSLAVHGSYSYSTPKQSRTIGEYVLISGMHNSHAWMRTSRSGRWTVTSLEQIEAPVLSLCPSIFLRDLLAVQTRNLENLGPAPMDGRPTLHLGLRMPQHGGTYSIDYYLDQRSLYPVRVTLDQIDGSSHSHLLVRFRGYNTPVHIAAPAPAGPRPSTSSGPEQLLVTPNPAPASAALTVTVIAPAGSRCSPTLLFQRLPPSKAPSSSSTLNSLVVHSPGTARWTRKLPPDVRGGSVTVACKRGRITSNQVSSFIVFP